MTNPGSPFPAKTFSASDRAASGDGCLTLGRRRFLGLAGAGALAGLTTTWPIGAANASSHDAGTDLVFAVVTDTHADVDVPTNLSNLTKVFAAIEEESPAFVLNCGDITEYGADDEFAAYRGTIPDTLWPRMKHVPGNHEARWDVAALENYRKVFGPTSYSFTEGGLHFVALDPTQVLQEPGLFGPDDLRWLAADLAAAGADTPSVLFLHFPLGGQNYYVNDTEDLLSAIEPFSVRAIFAGHIHREEVTRFNGLTQVAAEEAKNQPFYYLVRRVAVNGISVLEVTHVNVTTGVRRPFTTIPLGPVGPGEGAGPLEVSVTATQVSFEVRVDAGAAAMGVSAKVYPQALFGGSNEGTWTALTRSGPGLWTGSLNAQGLAPGVHRVQVRAQDASGARWEATARVQREVPGAGLPILSSQRLSGQIQGALAHHDGLVVAASTSGAVEAFRPTTGGHVRQWQAQQLGGVYRAAAFNRAGDVVVVPSADHHVYALDSSTGQQRWKTDLGVPVLSAPVITTIAGKETVIVSAGSTVHALDMDGTRRWQSRVPVMSAGRAVCDGERVYVGAGDGNAYAYDAVTGAQLWSFSTNTRATRYQRLIYGPWDDTVELLADGSVLISTVTDAWALDSATGGRRWQRKGGYIFSPVLPVLNGTRLLMIDEWGMVALVDPATGVHDWTVQMQEGGQRVRVLNGGPVVSTDGAKAWVVGTGGLLVGIDLTSGTLTERRQLFTANTFSTPVLVDGLLVVGAQDGWLRTVLVEASQAGPPPVIPEVPVAALLPIAGSAAVAAYLYGNKDTGSAAAAT